MYSVYGDSVLAAQRRVSRLLLHACMHQINQLKMRLGKSDKNPGFQHKTKTKIAAIFVLVGTPTGGGTLTPPPPLPWP